MTKPYLSVAIVTHSPQGIERIERMSLPCIDDVEYVISWQDHRDAPVPASLSSRSDIRICRFDRSGLSLNRNNAIAHSAGEIILIGDDDLIYHPDGIRALMDSFRSDPTLDYASFRYDGPDNKTYPSASCSINPAPRFFHQTSFETAFRRSPRTAGLRFLPQFGIGSRPFAAGDDSVFFFMAQRMGLNCRFFPITIATHPGLSTGLRLITDPGVTLSKGALMALHHPVAFIPRIPLEAWRERRRGRASFFPTLFHLTRGALLILADRPLFRSIRHPEL